MKKAGFFLILIILVFSLCGCEKLSDEELAKNKIDAENEYLESKILYIVNQYLTEKYFNDENQLNWDDIEKDFSQISSSSSIIVMDLANVKIDNNTIYNFEKSISNCNSAISTKDFNMFFKGIYDLYNFIPEFEKQTANLETVQVRSLKGKLVGIIYYSSINDFESSKLLIDKIENEYNELIKNEEYLEENSYKVNRIYVEIQELKLSIENNNQEEVIDKYFDIIKFL